MTEIRKCITSALNKLMKYDEYLLRVDINERSLSHRLAMYLEPYFEGWNVDCEYNRDHYDPKRLNIKRVNIYSNDTEAVTVFPDIIVHKRGTTNNLLVIEIKKSSNRNSPVYDYKKLRAFKRELCYEYAVFIRVGVGDNYGKNEIGSIDKGVILWDNI